MRDVERLHHLLVVLRVLLRVVREDEDRTVAGDLVRQLVHRHDLLQRLLQRHTVQLHRRRGLRHLRVVGDVDAARVAERVEDVANVGVPETEAQRLARRRVQQRLGRGGASAFAQLLDGRPGTSRLDALADGLVERNHLRGRLAIGRLVLRGQLVFAACGFKLVLFLVAPGLVEMRSRGGELRASECDLVVRIIGSGLRCRAVVRHRLVEIASLDGRVAMAERLPGDASRGYGHHGEQEAQACHSCPHSSPESIVTTNLPVRISAISRIPNAIVRPASFPTAVSSGARARRGRPSPPIRHRFA